MNFISKLRFKIERTKPMFRKKRIRRGNIFSLNGGFEGRELPDVGTKIDDIYTVVTCPVCGYKVCDNYDICTHCGWENEPVDEYEYSGANGATLHKYKKQYEKIIRKARILK